MKKSIRLGAVIFLNGLLLSVGASAAEPVVTDAQHIAMYNDCLSKELVNVKALAGFIGSIVSANVPAFLGDLGDMYMEGYKQKGCDVFLTSAQIIKRNAIQQKLRMDDQRPPGNPTGQGSH